MTTGRAVLEVDGIGVSFGSREILKTASFSAWPGRITALMGRNGVGKTTLLRVAIGRVRPDWGRVLYQGELCRKPSLAKLAQRGLMYSAQDSALTWRFTVAQHLRAFQDIYPGGPGIDDVVRTLKLEPLLDRRPDGLSGGERQRASLALALLRRPACLLMDEPFAAVAPVDRHLVAEGLLALKRAGAALVISGHDVDDLFAVADEIIWVVAGTSHWLGTPASAATHHQFRRTYLGPRGRIGIAGS